MTKRLDQNIFDKEKEIQEHLRIVPSFHLEGGAKEARTQSPRKEGKGTKAKPKKSRIPRM